MATNAEAIAAALADAGIDHAFGLPGGEYQSVTIEPVIGSSEAYFTKSSVSRAACNASSASAAWIEPTWRCASPLRGRMNASQSGVSAIRPPPAPR